MAISTQHKGKQGELFVFSELLRRGAQLYTPVVDIGVDALVRGHDGKYKELQVKATQAADQDRYFNFKWEPKQDRFFICVSLRDEPYSVWVIPWHAFKEHAQRSKTTDNWHLPLPQKVRGDPSGKTREELLDRYRASKHSEAWRPLLPPDDERHNSVTP